MVMLALFVAMGSIQAQENGKAVVEAGRELTRAEKRALQDQMDSLLFVQALQAINNKDFALEADQVVFKYGQTAYVTANTNFISVKGDKAVVQVAFNIPVAGPNGLGGVTVDGMVSDYTCKPDKKGNVFLSMNVMGTGISARVDISMYKGSNRASVTISPNFNSNRLTLNGVILPSAQSNIFKGRSL